MHGVTLRRTRVYDAQGLQEPKSVLWKTPKLFTINPEETISRRAGEGGLFSGVATYYAASSIITANKEAYFRVRLDKGDLFFVIDLQTGEAKKRFNLQNEYFSQPVVAGDLLFLGASDGGFSAFDRRDWKAKWQIVGRKGYRYYAISPAVADGMIYCGDAEEIKQPNWR